MAFEEEFDPVPAVYVVVADVIHGTHAAPVLGDGLFCSIGCAAVGVRQLAHSISAGEHGSAFVLRYEGRPVGCVATSGGRMWRVQILGSHELAATR